MKVQHSSSGPILERKGMHVIFQKKGKNGKNTWKFGQKSGLELTVCETQFAIHFDKFAEHLFLIFVKLANQYLIVKLSFILKQR